MKPGLVSKRAPTPEQIRAAYLEEYYDIWRCYYDASCPTAEQRDAALADLTRRYPNQEAP